MRASNEGDRVRENTSESINARVERETRARVERCAGEEPAAISSRISELEREWDVERYLELIAPSLSLTGIALAARGDRRWLALPAVVLSFLVQHAVQGWCPPLPLLRQMGIRTREEVERERYALKALRGDFNGISSAHDGRAVERALSAVGLQETGTRATLARTPSTS